MADKVEKEKQDQTVKVSDFSIDHILNRAGNSSDRTVIYEGLDGNAGKFQWLQCSRYCPPKVPRIPKKDAHKRQLGRHPRIPFSSYQLSILEQKFKESPYLSSEEVIELSKKLQLVDTRVKIWFQNRRARERREKNGPVFNGEVNKSKDHKKDVHSDISDRLPLNCFSVKDSSDNNSLRRSSGSDRDYVEINDYSQCSKSDIPSPNRTLPSNFVAEPFFVAHGIPFFLPNVNFVNNKDAES